MVRAKRKINGDTPIANRTYDALTNGSGAIQEAYDCDAYGRTIAYDTARAGGWFSGDETATNNPKCQFIFTGRRFDPETSDATTQMYFYRARYYSPVLGRFISRDPIDYDGGMNLYEYVGGMVVGAVDPEGLNDNEALSLTSPPAKSEYVPRNLVLKPLFSTVAADSPMMAEVVPHLVTSRPHISVADAGLQLPPIPGRYEPGLGFIPDSDVVPSHGIKVGGRGNQQNCVGAAAGIKDWIQPSDRDIAALQIGLRGNPAEWFKMNFNPMKDTSGRVRGICRIVPCSSAPMVISPCKHGEREIVAWIASYGHNRLLDAHFVGRTVGPRIWNRVYSSKIGREDRVVNIRSPKAHYKWAYPAAANSPLVRKPKICWCCTIC